MTKDVIGFRVRSEVKSAYDNLTDRDKDRIKAIVEELILLHASGFSVELLKRELDSLRAELCPQLLRIIEYYDRSSCIQYCHDDYVKSYFYRLVFIVREKLCKTYPVRPQPQPQIQPQQQPQSS